ncbi:MAG: Fic family protein [Bacilli bacterium]
MLFAELTDKNNFFRKKYVENLINRFINASLTMENIDDDLANTIQALNIFYQTEALELALSQEEDTLRNPIDQCTELKELIKIVSGEEFDGFRPTRAIVEGSNIQRTSPKKIQQDLYYMYDNYNNFIPYTNEVDEIYLKEAQLHIRLLHIHPFQDGNGRVSRIILIRNLLHQNKIPCVITKEVKKEYCNYIENSDEIGLAKLFERLSEKEFQTMICLYNELDKKGLLKENKMTPDQQEKYNNIIGKKETKPKEKGTLRNIEDIISIFKYGKVLNNKKLITQKNCRHKVIYDIESNDYAVYFEDTKMMIIRIENDPRLYMVKQTVNGIEFYIDQDKKYPNEFEYEINNNKTKETETGYVKKYF